jgi:1-acyl-sn-glycerol-3-phosphate acyltransferase
MRLVRAGWRLLRLSMCLLGGMGTMLWHFPNLTEHQKKNAIQAWALKILDCLAIQMEATGDALRPGPLLLAANHISWIDIVALQAARHCRFVAKADLRTWPLIGWMANTAGTLFLRRESRRDAMNVVRQMADSLATGDVLAVFPEGTTSDGLSVLPFHANLFQSAVSRNAPVQAVLVTYVDTATGRLSHAADFVGAETLLSAVWRTLCTPSLRVRIQFAEPQWADGRDRRVWAADLHAEVLRMQAQARAGQPPAEMAA